MVDCLAGPSPFADAVTRKLNQGGGAQFFSEIGLVLIDEVRSCGTCCSCRLCVRCPLL